MPSTDGVPVRTNPTFDPLLWESPALEEQAAGAVRWTSGGEGGVAVSIGSVGVAGGGPE